MACRLQQIFADFSDSFYSCKYIFSEKGFVGCIRLSVVSRAQKEGLKPLI